MVARASTKAAAPVEEPDEDEFEEMEEGTDEIDAEDDDDLEELEEVDEEEEETPPAKGKAKPKAKAAPKQPTIQYGSPWLASYITEKTGDTYDSRGIRMLLRKLARDGNFDRTIGEDRGRYEFTGPNDPTVKAVLAMVKSGEAKELKQAGLDAVKQKAAEKKAAAKAAAEAEADEVEEIEEEAPKPRRRAAAPKASAPAKATPAKAAPRRTARTNA